MAPISGQIWLDELRVSEISREGGIAARGSATLKIADVGKVSFSVTKQDADFHRIQEKIGKAGRSVESYSYRLNNTFQSNKLLPARWGLSIPITFNISRSVKTPKYLPGTDIRIQGAAPDSIKNLNNQKKFGISFKKNSKSRSRLIKYTIDRSSWNLRFSGLEKLPIFSKFTKSVSLEHGFGGKENEKGLETIRFIQETKMDSISKEITGVIFLKVMLKVHR